MKEPYLPTVFSFMGIAELHFFQADGLSFADESYGEFSLVSACAKLLALAKTW